jgi:hypothetical protein
MQSYVSFKFMLKRYFNTLWEYLSLMCVVNRSDLIIYDFSYNTEEDNVHKTDSHILEVVNQV